MYEDCTSTVECRVSIRIWYSSLIFGIGYTVQPRNPEFSLTHSLFLSISLFIIYNINFTFKTCSRYVLHIDRRNVYLSYLVTVSITSLRVREVH